MSSPSEAWLAQSVEHQTFNLRVTGSSPVSGCLTFVCPHGFCHLINISYINASHYRPLEYIPSIFVLVIFLLEI